MDPGDGYNSYLQHHYLPVQAEYLKLVCQLSSVPEHEIFSQIALLRGALKLFLMIQRVLVLFFNQNPYFFFCF
jgi:hypothetical protein